MAPRKSSTPPNSAKITRKRSKPAHKRRPKQLNSTELRALKRKWAKKLADSGFNDIESRDGRFIMGQALDDKRFQERYTERATETQHYYSRWSSYLHRQTEHKWTRLSKLVVERYSAGVPIFHIFKEAKRKQWYSRSQFHFYYVYFPKLASRIETWNRTNPHGMDFISDVGL